MQVSWASASAPHQVNQDLVLTGPNWVVVLDGATPRFGVSSGCVHDVPWLVRQLASQLARLLCLNERIDLADALADAIAATCAAHAHSCDLSNPASPSSTAAVVRHTEARIEYLVLADSVVVVDDGRNVSAIVDDRLDHLPDYTNDGIARSRNTEDGFWVASTTPAAAHHALQGHIPTRDVHRLAVLTDGAARTVTPFAAWTWPQLLHQLDEHGPTRLIATTRAWERTHPIVEQHAGRRAGRPRHKQHDDATAVLITDITDHSTSHSTR